MLIRQRMKHRGWAVPVSAAFVSIACGCAEEARDEQEVSGPPGPPGVAYYVGMRQTVVEGPDGSEATPSSTAVATLSLDSDQSRLELAATWNGPRGAMDLSRTIEMSGGEFSVQDPGGTYSGSGTVTGEAWAWAWDWTGGATGRTTVPWTGEGTLQGGQLAWRETVHREAAGFEIHTVYELQQVDESAYRETVSHFGGE